MFYLLIVFLFVPGMEMSPGIGAQRQVLTPKFEPSAAACKADQLKALKMQAPWGVIVGAKCTGPMQDPTIPKQKV